jgi:hypothetical protein
MKIILKGDLHPELLILGLKPGDEINANIQKNKAAYFTIHTYCIPVECVVYPDNYEKINV